MTDVSIDSEPNDTFWARSSPQMNSIPKSARTRPIQSKTSMQKHLQKRQSKTRLREIDIQSFSNATV